MTEARSTIGLLHPGQMGAAVGAQLAVAGHVVLWLPAGRSDSSARRAGAAGLRAAADLTELLAASDVVLSICPPAAASELAAQVADAAPVGGLRGVYVDANAISPHRMIEISSRFRTVVDGSIIGPPPRPDRSARVYLSGDHDAVALLHGVLAGTRAEPVVLSERIGDASALKMAFGSYNKASHALAAVSHALAERYGVGAALRAEGDKEGGGALAKLHRLPSVAARAWRWGPEMLQAAESFAAVGLPAELATGAAAVFERWEADKDSANLDIAEVLRHLHADD